MRQQSRHVRTAETLKSSAIPGLRSPSANADDGDESHRSDQGGRRYLSPRVDSAVAIGNLLPDLGADDSGAEAAGPGQENESPQMPRRISAALRRRKDLLEYPIENEGLVFDPKRQVLYHFNETAFYIWRLCDGRSRNDMARALSRAYDVDEQTVGTHLTEVTDLFSLGGLVNEEMSNAAGP